MWSWRGVGVACGIMLAAAGARSVHTELLSAFQPDRAGRTLQQAGSSPTFTVDIAPILFAKCSVCHHPGGAAPFSVLSYDSVRQRAALIADATERRIMPPWKAEPDENAFIGMEPLTTSQIHLIRQWVDRGAPEGDPGALPPAPQWNADWQLGKPDLIVTLPQPYTLPAEGTDLFRIFVFPLPVDGTKYVRGIEFHPGNQGVVHHATIRVDDTPASRKLDEEDPGPGYEGLLAHSAGYPDGHFLGWTPGQVPPLLPKGLAWTLNRGTDLVVQLHLQPTGKPEEVRPSIGFYFGADPPERTPAMIRLGRQNIEIPAGAAAFKVTDSYVVPVDIEVQAVQPHAHYRAREIKGIATLPDGTTKSLIHIPQWDFRWQHVFRYVKPVALPKGTRLAMEYTYDNSEANVNNKLPLQRVLWGQNSSDEMGDLWIQVLTASEQDRVTLNSDFQPKMLAEDIVGAEMLVRAQPTRVALHDDAALLYLTTLPGSPASRQPDLAARAVAHFATSASLRPASAATHYNLGLALTVEAGTTPGSASQKLTEAIREYQKALELQPDYAAAHNNLGSVFLQRGNIAEAVLHLSEAVRLEPRNVLARYSLGRADRAAGNRRGAIENFRVALQQRPNWAPVINDLAFLLATSPEDGLRDGVEAKRLAQLAVNLTNGREAAALDALAAAYAETGEFDEAITMAELAVQRAPPAGAALITQRLALYRAHKPLRVP